MAVKKKRKKKPSIKSLIKILDENCKAVIFKRDEAEFGSNCSLCGELNGFMQWCHLISAKKYATRWDPLNVYRQCRGCNMRHEFYPEYYTAWWVNRHGEAKYQELVRASMVPANYKRKDYYQMIFDMKITAGAIK